MLVFCYSYGVVMTFFIYRIEYQTSPESLNGSSVAGDTKRLSEAQMRLVHSHRDIVYQTTFLTYLFAFTSCEPCLVVCFF